MNSELPPLKWDEYCWTGEIILPSWRGFQAPHTRRARSGPADPTTGAVCVRFDTDGAGNVPPTEAQIAAYRWLVAHETEVAAAVLNGIFAAYPRFREEYLDAYNLESEPEVAAVVPVLDRAEQLTGMMGLYAVFVLPLPNDGVGYVGFEFGCAWEREHGLGVLTNRNRVVEIGQADTAFDGNRAEEDAYHK